MTGLGDVLQHDRRFECRPRCWPKCECAVIRKQYRWTLRSAVFHDGFADVVADIVHIGDAGDFRSKFVSYGREVRRNRAVQYCETGGVIGVSLHNTADVWATGIQIEMVRQVDAGVEFIPRFSGLEFSSCEVSGDQ